MLRSIILAFVWLPLAPAFAYQPAASAAEHHEDTIDKVLGMLKAFLFGQVTRLTRTHHGTGPAVLTTYSCWGRLRERALANGRTAPKNGGKVGVHTESAMGATLHTTPCAKPSPTEPPSFFTKTTDISLRISTVSGHGRATQFSAL